MEHEYKTSGTCASRITFDLDGDIVRNVSFTGGCNGNLQAVSHLVEGLTVEEIERRCGGIRCGFKSTSCADQLARAIRKAYNEEQQTDSAPDGE